MKKVKDIESKKTYAVGDFVLAYYLDEWLSSKILEVLPENRYKVEICLLMSKKTGLLAEKTILDAKNIKEIKICD